MTFVSAHALAGGAERYLTLLLDALEPSWIGGVILLADGPLVERLRGRGLPVSVLPTGASVSSLFRAALALRSRLTDDKVQVVHADGVKAALVCAVATFGKRTPVVWVKHDFSWDGPVANVVATACDQVVAVSEAVAGTFGRRLRRKVHVVHNGIPASQPDRAAARHELMALTRSPGDAPLVGLVGRLHPAKGQRELLAVAPRLRDRIPGVRIVFVGGEDPSQTAYATELRERVVHDRLEETVIFTGAREDASTLVAGCDVIALPSVPDERGMGREGFGFVALEAMAAETPVVAYREGALPEVLGDCALLVPQGDRQALLDGLVGLLEARGREDGSARRLARCGRARVTERFPLETTVAAMKERYREAAAR